MYQQAQKLQLASVQHTPPQRLAAYKAYIAWAEKLLRRFHRIGADGFTVCLYRSVAIDVLIEHLHQLATERIRQETGKNDFEVAILALGGYGRGELCPHSDVDIMFLYPHKSRLPDFQKIQKIFNDSVLYMLWDLGLKVGHSTRSYKDVLLEAQKDVQSKNAMLEARHICGSFQLTRHFQKAYDHFIQKDDVQKYIEERLTDQRLRHKKFGGTVFLQEPDIKNGVGGLRDYHNILWMARLKLNSRDINHLLEERLLRKDEHAAFVRAYNFLLRVRTELHLQSRKPSDVLNIDKQPQIAQNLGYRQPGIFHRVELFMRDYYKAAQMISRISGYLERRLALESHTRISFSEVLMSRRHAHTKSVDGFIVREGVLYAENQHVFHDDPIRLIRVFRHVQRLDVEMDFELKRLVEDSAERLPDHWMQSEEAHRAFKAILQDKGSVYRPLHLMNESGILQRFLPEWNSLHCLVQHEYYHRYTADEHTLFTIRELDQVFNRSSVNAAEATKYREAVEKTDDPWLLYLVLLLHDIGKGEGIENHAAAGAEIAEPVLKRFGISEDSCTKILFLIGKHLEMARFWQKFDLDDPQTIFSFVELMRSRERLHYLYVLTYCDARGTTQDLWNGYKDTLHTQLYLAALRCFEQPQSAPTDPVMIPKDSIRAKVPSISDDEVEAHFNLMPERYFSYHSSDEIALHLQMVHSLLENIAQAASLGSLVPVVEWRDDLNIGLTVVHIVTWDRAGLFYKLAGAFSLAGLNIVSSKALTRADHITIDTFYVSDDDGGPVQSHKIFATFQHHLESALLHNKDLGPEIRRMAEKRQQPSYLNRRVHLPAPIPPSVEVYHELNLRRTIIEIQCSDEIGLLYRITKAIYDNGFDITFARISTERHVAADAFYIEPMQPTAQNESQKMLDLREALEEIAHSASHHHHHVKG